MEKAARILVWGCGKGLKEVFEKYPICMNNIVGLVDANRDLQGKSIYNSKVISPEEIDISTFDYIFITVKNDDVVNSIKAEYSQYRYIDRDEFLDWNMKQISCFAEMASEGNDEKIMRYYHRVLRPYGCYPVAIPDSIYFFNKYTEYENLLNKYIGKNVVNQLKDISRLHSLMLNINRLVINSVEGAFAELGVYLGNNSAVLYEYAQIYDRKLFLFDTFEGFDDRDLVGIDSNQEMQFKDTSLEAVKKFVGENRKTIYVKGYFPESVTEECKNEKYAFVSIDCDLYIPIKAGLEFFYPRLSKGGMIFIHDYSGCFFEGARQAVDEYCRVNCLTPVLLSDKAGTAVITKSL